MGDVDPWTRHMRAGEWARAWALCDADLPARRQHPCWDRPRHLQSIWTGEPLAGRRVLVRCYHGLGDTLQFIRYVPLLREIAAEVIVWAQPGLLPLLQGMDGIDRLLPLHDGAPAVAYDVDVEVMELAHVFRTTPDTVPGTTPYLDADPLPLARDPRPAVGLVWQGGDWDPGRALSWAQVAPLARLQGVRCCILQPQAHAAGWDGSAGEWLGEFDLAAYARALRAMDLVVTIDSMPAHLAGALGVPTWTLLREWADWRWMEAREDTPWYPCMRLFRQSRDGDWDDVVARVAAALREFSARPGP